MSVLAGAKFLIGDWLGLKAATIEKPIVKLIQQSAQSVPSDTDTEILFGPGSEDTDTHGYHDTRTLTHRITPQLAGYYRLTGGVFWGSDTDLISWYSAIAKNGSVQAPRVRDVLPATATANLTRGLQVSTILQANGTSDYFSLVGRQLQNTPGALNTLVGSSLVSCLECEFLRPL